MLPPRPFTSALVLSLCLATACAGQAPSAAPSTWQTALERRDAAALFALSEQLRHRQWPEGYATPPLRHLHELQAALHEQLGAFIAWTPLPDGRLLTLAATAKQATFFVQELPPWTDELLEQFLLALQTPPQAETLQDDFAQYALQAQALYELLLSDVLNWLPSRAVRLLVAPFGKWHLLPLQTLIAEVEFPVASYQYLPFLAKKYRFTYTLSASQWLASRRAATEADKPDTRVRLIAPDYFGYRWPYPHDSVAMRYLRLLQSDEGDLPALPATATLSEIARRLGGEVWRGAAATPARLRSPQAPTGIWHAEAHLLATTPQPDGLLLALTPYDDDGILPLSTLPSGTMPARLAILPACHWSMLPLAQAAHAFAALHTATEQAGATTRLVNLWFGTDTGTEALFEQCYERLRAGLTPSEALAQAQIAWLNEAKANLEAHPYYWAGYAVHGADTPIPLRRSPLWWYVPAAAALMVWFVWRYLRQLRREEEEAVE